MRELDIPATTRQLIAFIQTAVKEAGFKRVVAAVSGGVDSATATALASTALGPENVFALMLPYRNWHTEAGRLARGLLQQIQIPLENINEIDITPMAEAFLGSAKLQNQTVEGVDERANVDSLRLGNVMARLRMVVLFDHAKRINVLVLGTENKSEHYLGYYTRFGDEASDMEPLRNLYKTEVYRLAEYLAIPKEIQEAAPTAGLWVGQTDEGQFGFTYQAADEILYGLYEAQLPPQELIKRGLDSQTIDDVQAWVEHMAFKHQLPVIAPEPVVIKK